MVIVGGLIVLGFAWLVITALLARSQLQDVRADLHKMRAQIAQGDLSGARSTARDLSAHAARAHGLTTGPVWATVSAVPGAGSPATTLRAMTAQVDRLAHTALPALVHASKTLDPSALRTGSGAIDVGRLAAAAPDLDAALTDVNRAVGTVASRPADSWLGSVDAGRASLLRELRGAAGSLGSFDLAAHVGPPMLGADGPRRYFVAFQNDAEARGTGGIPGAFAIVRADHGAITFERFLSDSVLHGRIPTGLDFGTGYDSVYGNAETTRLYVNSNLSPNFPYAARIWLAMWRQRTGEKLDGAVAVDAGALADLLRVTGPATLPGGAKVTGGNVVTLTERRVYAKYPALSANDQRKHYLLSIAEAASHKLLKAPGSVKLLHALAKAVSDRRLLLYSANGAEESRLGRSAVAGAIARTSGPYAGLSIVNDAGNKLDYYLDRSLDWHRSGCGSRRAVTVTVRLTNNAPASGLSTYVTARHDRHSYPVRPGDNRLEVSYYASAGAELQSVQLDGAPATAGTGADLGHPVFSVDVEVPRGRTTTVVLHLVEPGRPGPVQVLRQPLVRPLRVSAHDSSC
jgi:hypothetical protein